MGHTDEKVLKQKLDHFKKININNTRVLHNNVYTKVDVVLNEVNEELLILYKSLDDGDIVWGIDKEDWDKVNFYNRYNIKDLKEKLNDVNVKAEEIYYHHSDKEKHYKIIGKVVYYNTQDVLIIYQALYGERLVWARDSEQWFEFVNGGTKFTKVY